MKQGLVADVGGTNIRLALVKEHGGDLLARQSYPCQQFTGLAGAISHYLAEIGQQVDRATIAIAGPCDTDLLTMTNLGWQFSQAETKKALGLRHLQVINDFTAIALAIPHLTAEQLITIYAPASQGTGPKAVCGPGTGLGVAHLIPRQDNWLVLPGEGGHQNFAPQNAQEEKLLSFLRPLFGHVSAERLLSGPGLVNIYQALNATTNSAPLALTAAEITDHALKKTCPICQETLALFCRALGSFSGDLALNMACWGGIYLAGGIVPRFPDYLRHSDFLKSFQAKGRFRPYLENIPVFIIMEPYPGLIGAASQMFRG